MFYNTIIVALNTRIVALFMLYWTTK